MRDRGPAGRPPPGPDRPAHRVRHRRRAARHRAGRHRRAAGRRGGRRHLGAGRVHRRARSSAASAATGGRRTAARCSPPGSTRPACRAGTCTTRPGPTYRPATVAYPHAGGAERRGHAAPARPRRRLGRRALGPGDLPVPGGGRLDRGRPADHRAAPPAAARPGARGRPAHRRDPGARRARRPALGRAGHRHARATCPTAGCWSAASWPTTGTTPAACSPTARLLTPPSLYVRRVVGRMPGPGGSPDLLVEASDGEPSEQHLFRVRTAIGGGGVESRRLTTAPGLAQRRGRRRRAGRRRASRWTTPGMRLDRVAGRPAGRPAALARRDAAVRAPARRSNGSPTGGCRRPCSTRAATSPGAGCRCCSTSTAARATRRSAPTRAAWLERQWWADAGFAVVTVDNRGTPGRGARRSRRSIHRRLADVILTDQVDALGALADKHPDLDLGRVAIRGLVVRRLAGRAGRAAPPGRVPLRDRRRAGRRLGRCTTPRTPSATWACPATPRTCTRTTRWSSSPPSR